MSDVARSKDCEQPWQTKDSSEETECNNRWVWKKNRDHDNVNCKGDGSRKDYGAEQLHKNDKLHKSKKRVLTCMLKQKMPHKF